MLLVRYLLAVGIIHFASADFVGKFVFHGAKENKGDHPATLSILNKPDSVNIAPNAGPLPADEISSVLSLSLGLSVSKDITWNGLLAGKLFKRPKAVLMFSVDSLPKGAKLNIPSTEQIPIELTDDVSSVGDIYAMTSSVSLAGHVNQMMDGHSITVSISADEETAAMGYSQGDSSTTAFWSEMADSWKIVSGDGKNNNGLSKHALFKRITSVLPKGFTLDMENKKVIVNTDDFQFSFNLVNHADFNLFSELVYMQWQYEQLAMNKKAVKDGASDVYLFAVSALKGIEKQYGVNSKQMKGALKMLESFIPQMVRQFTGLYGGNILIVGLTMESELSRMEPHKEALDTVLDSLKDQLADKFNFVLPDLHAVKNLEHRAQQNLCESVQGAIAKFAPSLKFKCNDHSTTHKLRRRSLLSTEEKTADFNLAYIYTSDFAAIFNIWFWLLVVIAIATYAIAISMWNMDPGRDSIIYRMTEQRIKSD